jgi:DNA-binding response OmpR family regulator
MDYDKYIITGSLIIDLATEEVFVSGQRKKLNRNRFSLLLLLAWNKGEVVSTDKLQACLGGIPTANQLRKAIQQLRQILWGVSYTAEESPIQAVVGQGYRLEDSAPDCQALEAFSLLRQKQKVLETGLGGIFVFNGARVRFPTKERQVLEALVTHGNNVMTYEQIIHAVWKGEQDSSNRQLVQKLGKRICRRIEMISRESASNWIEALWQQGLRLVCPIVYDTPIVQSFRGKIKITSEGVFFDKRRIAFSDREALVLKYMIQRGNGARVTLAEMLSALGHTEQYLDESIWNLRRTLGENVKSPRWIEKFGKDYEFLALIKRASGQAS